jgi:hypothetical protein
LSGELKGKANISSHKASNPEDQKISKNSGVPLKKEKKWNLFLI